jgi:hypothetical protein
LTIIELATGRSAWGNHEDGGELDIGKVLSRIVNKPSPRLPDDKAFPNTLGEKVDKCL